MLSLFKKFSKQPFAPAAAMLAAALAFAIVASPAPRAAAEADSPLVLAQTKADKGKAPVSQINPGGTGTGKGTQCPAGKKPFFVPSRGKGAGEFQCR
jgi:hypothetical protein